MPDVDAKERLATLYGRIEGVTKATAKVPRTLLDAQLPCVVVFPRASQITRSGSGLLSETRDYGCVLFIEKALFGTAQQGYVKANPFYDRVRDYFMARPGLDNPDDPDVVFDAEFLGDNGLEVNNFPPGSPDVYFAIEFRHRVNELAEVNYED